MARTVNSRGNPMTLVGRVLAKGKKAPDFKVVAQDMSELSMSSFSGKIKVLTSFPSLDTQVCDLQVKEFNRRATQFSPEVTVVGISKDLPFAQKRFCEAYNITNVTIASDYKSASFGINYGLLIKELNLLARSVLIVDKNDVLRYVQIVPEVTNQPDYEDVLINIDYVLKDPALSIKSELPDRCTPYEGGTPPLPAETVNRMIVQHPGWRLIEGRKIAREFKFKDFIEAKYFLDLIAAMAEEQGHHPNISLSYNLMTVTLTTQAARGLTENDFIMARIIDELGG